MIIFYNKKTGIVFGTVDGRVHSPEEIESSWIQPSTMAKEDIGKYVVPFEPIIVEEEVPILEWRIVDEKTKRAEQVVVGKKKEKVVKGLKPAVPFADLIYDFEKGKERICDYCVKLDKEGKVKGFEKISKE